MKALAKLELTIILLALAPGAWAQGTVTFANATSSYGSAIPDHLVRFNPFLVYPFPGGGLAIQDGGW